MSGIIAQNSGRHTGLVKASSGGDAVWNLIKTYTASSDSDLSFVEGTDDIDFTAYDEFVFKFINIHPSAGSKLGVNFSIDTGSNYNVTKTTTSFIAQHDEADSYAQMLYTANDDLAQSTAVALLMAGSVGTGNDENIGGYLHCFGLSSTTFVKHFMSQINYATSGPATNNTFVAGYGNTTSAIDAVQFTLSTGNIDAGQISLYGIS